MKNVEFMMYYCLKYWLLKYINSDTDESDERFINKKLKLNVEEEEDDDNEAREFIWNNIVPNA